MRFNDHGLKWVELGAGKELFNVKDKEKVTPTFYTWL